MTLGLYACTLDRACYDRAFHTLALERAHYLCSLDREAELDTTTAKVHDLEFELDVGAAKVCDLGDELDSATSKVRELEFSNQSLTESQASDVEVFLSTQVKVKEASTTLAFERDTRKAAILIASDKEVATALAKAAKEKKRLVMLLIR